MKYIDAEKLITEIESISLIPQISAGYNDGREDMKMMILDIIDSLQQEQTEIDLEQEIDFFLYGTYTPERFPNTMQVRDEHTGLRVNDWKCRVNKPEYKVEFARHFYELGLNVRKDE